MSKPFSSSVDIANRALQRVGSERIAALTDTTKRASEVNACYNQLRTAELRRRTWRFAIRTAALRPIDTTTLLLVPATWSSTARYIVGSVVTYNDSIFIGIDPINTNHAPDVSPLYWMQYFGPLTVNVYDSTTTYFAGELVYTHNPASEFPAIYLAMTTGSDDNPDDIAAWDETINYNVGDTVTFSAATWQSNFDLNINNEPFAFGTWDSGTTYNTNDTVVASNNHNYTSVVDTNLNHDPTTDDGSHWTDNGLALWSAISGLQPDQMQGQNWLKLAFETKAKSIRILYPPNCGPVGQPATRNLYKLPNGFLREAPQDPKAGSTSFLGAPSGRQYDDWNFQDDFLITMESRPIIFRFVADVANVRQYDPMFCEGLASRIAFEVCETLTNSTAKLQAIGAEYKQFMTEAGLVNAIETGAVEPPLDDWIAARV